jgi:multisubunit Na+/H+ antiporter MnhC subunit
MKIHNVVEITVEGQSLPSLVLSFVVQNIEHFHTVILHSFAAMI